MLFISAHTYGQAGAYFAIEPIVEIVQKRFKLNKRELAVINPLIHQENIDVLRIYARFGGGEPQYSAALWQEIILKRIDFESRISVKLSNRQKRALTAARTELEDRVLSSVVDDFVFTLGPFLDLSSYEMDAVQNIFYSEYKQKHQSIVRQLDRLSDCQKELQAITNETERRMRSILSPFQFRDYKSLSEPADSLIGLL